MAAEKPKENQEQFAAQCIEALYEKDRLNYAGEFVQGFVHNTNGPLQNLTMLAEMDTVRPGDTGQVIPKQFRGKRKVAGDAGKTAQTPFPDARTDLQYGLRSA